MFQPHLQLFKKRFGVGRVVKGKDKDAVRCGQRAVFGHVGVWRQPAGQYAQKAFDDSCLARAAHTHQRQYAATAAAPPLANGIELRPMLPIVRAQQRVNEKILG